jgi:hypothetical protein
MREVADIMLEGGHGTLCFSEFQRHLRDPFGRLDKQRPGTVIVLPSMTMDHAGLAKIPGVRHYEERLLVLLQVLRRPTARWSISAATAWPLSLWTTPLTWFPRCRTGMRGAG